MAGETPEDTANETDGAVDPAAITATDRISHWRGTSAPSSVGRHLESNEVLEFLITAHDNQIGTGPLDDPFAWTRKDGDDGNYLAITNERLIFIVEDGEDRESFGLALSELTYVSILDDEGFIVVGNSAENIGYSIRPDDALSNLNKEIEYLRAMAADADDSYDIGSVESLLDRVYIAAGATAFFLSTVLFAILATLFGSFPTFSLSATAYATSVTLPIWGYLFLATATGTATATAYWYSTQVAPMLPENMRDPFELFGYAFGVILVLTALMGLLRSLVSIAVLLISIGSTIVGPGVLILGLVKRRIGIVALSFVLLLFWIGSSGIVLIGLPTRQEFTLYGIMTILFITTVLPAVVMRLKFDLFGKGTEEFEDAVIELDSVLRHLDKTLLARHGLEIPYRRAAMDADAVDAPAEVVYTPPLDWGVVKAMNNYYQRLKQFEREVDSAVAAGGNTSSVAGILCAIVEQHLPSDTRFSAHERAVVSVATDILRSCVPVFATDDTETIAELERRLAQIKTDASDSGSDPSETASELRVVRTWIGNRARRVELHVELQSRQTEIRNRWAETAEQVFDLRSSRYIVT